MKLCLDCGKSKSDKGLYCKKCGYKHRIRPTGLKYILTKKNRASFKKGYAPWNKGTKGLMNTWNKGTKGLTKANSGSFKKGQLSWSKLNPEKMPRNEKHANWKGSKVGYGALHTWITREMGRAIICIECGSSKNVDWANKSHEYKRDLEDWLQLCRKCHIRYDDSINKSWITRKSNTKINV